LLVPKSELIYERALTLALGLLAVQGTATAADGSSCQWKDFTGLDIFSCVQFAPEKTWNVTTHVHAPASRPATCGQKIYHDSPPRPNGFHQAATRCLRVHAGSRPNVQPKQIWPPVLNVRECTITGDFWLQGGATAKCLVNMGVIT